MEVVLLDVLFGDVNYFNFHVLWTVQWRAQIKVTDVEACKFGSSARQDAVKYELEESRDAVGVLTSPG